MAETDLRTCLSESGPGHFRPWRNPNDSNRHSFQNKNKGIVWQGIAWSSASWNGIFTFFLETGLLLYLTLWKQKLWGLMLSEDEFDEHTRNWTCTDWTESGMCPSRVLKWLKSVCWGPSAPSADTGEVCAALSLCLWQHSIMRSPGITCFWLEAQPGFKSICGWW